MRIWVITLHYITWTDFFEILTACISATSETKCHSSCQNCSFNSYCGNEYACTACHAEEFKISENFDDTIFQCSNSCDHHLSFKLHEYYFCDTSSKMTEQSILNEENTKAPIVKYTSRDFVILGSLGCASVLGVSACCCFCYKCFKRKPPQPQIEPDVEMALIRPVPSYTRESKKPTFKKLAHVHLEDFKKEDLIGGGKFSRIYKGKLFDVPVALKIALKEGRNNIHNELQIYEKIEHAHIIPALGVHLGLENILFFEFRKYNLKDYFLDFGTEIKFIQLKQYCIQISDAMKYLHSMEILHCDLKIDNILVKDEKGEEIEISDFGCAIDLKNDNEPKFNGTITHTSYELLKRFQDPHFHAIPSKASDVWAFAVTVWQIFQKHDQLPKDFQTAHHIIKNCENGKKLPPASNMPEFFWQKVVIPCFDLHPQTRSTMAFLNKGFLKIESP